MTLQFQNNQKIAYLASLCTLFSLAENALPHFLPFFKLGLSNIPLLFALSLLSVKEYLLLGLLKWFISNLFSGLLFSYFGLFSLLSTLASVLVMLISYKVLKTKLSCFGYSLLGACSSNLVQLSLASLYLKVSLINLLPYFLLFSIITSIITAVFSYKIQCPTVFPKIENTNIQHRDKYLFLFPLIALLTVPFNHSIITLSVSFLLALSLQLYIKRKIKLSYYFVIFIITLLLSSFNGEGKVLFLSFTLQSLERGAIKALTLLTLVAISQSISYLIPIKEGLIGTTIAYSGILMATFEAQTGSLKQRLNSIFSTKEFQERPRRPLLKLNFVPILILSLSIILCFCLSIVIN